MDEPEAREWLRRELNVPRETFSKLDLLVEMLRAENDRQNLVAASTLESVWSRHIIDSAQLLTIAPPDDRDWIDLGSGAGFPGLIIALLSPARVTLVEQRPLRAGFLRQAVNALELGERTVVASDRAERLEARPYDVICARAFAPLDKLLDIALPFSRPETLWILPKGRKAKSELEAARASWQGDFRVEPSLTDSDAYIIVAEQVRRTIRGKQKQ